MLYALLCLSRTGSVGAVVHDFTFGLDHLRPAHRAGRTPLALIKYFLQKIKFFFLSAALAFHRPNHFRDYFTCPLDNDRIANADVLASDIIFVVQSRLLDGYPAHRDWLQDGVGIERAGSANADVDVSETGSALDGGELVGDCPSRLMANISQSCLQVKLVHFDHNPIGFIREAFPIFYPRLVTLFNLLNAFQPTVIRVYLKTERLEVCHGFPVG